jgi:hypothetical protein
MGFGASTFRLPFDEDASRHLVISDEVLLLPLWSALLSVQCPFFPVLIYILQVKITNRWIHNNMEMSVAFEF